MAITYPVTLPATPVARKQTITPFNAVAVSVSPFTMQQQVYEHQGGVWQADVEYPPMKRAAAEPMIAALMQLRGRRGTFLLGDPLAGTAQGTATGTPLVAGASQTGLTLATDGWTVSVTGILKAGDYLQIGSGTTQRLYKVMKDADSDGAGAVTLDIWPRLRESPANNAAITLASTKGVFRLSTNDTPWDEVPGGFYSIAFAAIEAI